MVTGYPQVMVGPQSAAAKTTPARRATGGLMTRAFRRVGQVLCGLSGHDLVRHYEQNRVALVCASCGHVSPGWELTAPLPQQRYAGDPERHQLQMMTPMPAAHTRPAHAHPTQARPAAQTGPTAHTSPTALNRRVA